MVLMDIWQCKQDFLHAGLHHGFPTQWIMPSQHRVQSHGHEMTYSACRYCVKLWCKSRCAEFTNQCCFCAGDSWSIRSLRYLNEMVGDTLQVCFCKDWDCTSNFFQCLMYLAGICLFVFCWLLPYCCNMIHSLCLGSMYISALWQVFFVGLHFLLHYFAVLRW